MQRFTIKNLLCFILIWIMSPLTMYVGIVYLHDRKYYFISLLLIIYAGVAFLLRYEKRDPKLRELMIVAVLVAIGVAGRGAFYMVPQFKPVLAVAIIAGVALDKQVGFLVGAMIAFISNFFFGQGPWTPWQMFAMGLVGLIAGILFADSRLPRSRVTMSIYGFISTLIIYGGIMNPASVMTFQAELNLGAVLTSYAMGINFDLILAVATFIFLFTFGEQMLEKIERIKIKYKIL